MINFLGSIYFLFMSQIWEKYSQLSRYTIDLTTQIATCIYIYVYLYIWLSDPNGIFRLEQ